MIELDIKIRAEKDENLATLIQIMTDSLREAKYNTDVTLSASIDKDTITIIRKETYPKEKP